jgi:hypothetical protein
MTKQTNAQTGVLQDGTKVRTWDGSIGTVLYFRAGWYGVRTADGLASEWQPSQLEAA